VNPKIQLQVSLGVRSRAVAVKTQRIKRIGGQTSPLGGQTARGLESSRSDRLPWQSDRRESRELSDTLLKTQVITNFELLQYTYEYLPLQPILFA
jgi:hypothetical protein